MVDAVLAQDYEVENPVTNARGRVRFEESATPSDKLLREEIEAVKVRVASLELDPGNRIDNGNGNWIGNGNFNGNGNGDGVLNGNANLVGAIKVGDIVSHLKFGPGRVEAVDGHKLFVDFERAGRKKVLDSFVTRG